MSASMSFDDVRREWSEFVGRAIAMASEPVALVHDGTLHVRCASRAWAAKLCAIEGDIITRLLIIDRVRVRRIRLHWAQPTAIRVRA